ncbi:HEPN family nuclease [Bradyrhizobium sp. UFLA05-109]
MLREAASGKLSLSRCEREVDLKLRRLSFRLEMTQSVTEAFADLNAAVKHFASHANPSDKEQAKTELHAVLEWLGLLGAALENATLPYATRNEAEEFARRSRKNLIYVVEGQKHGAAVHVVTQLTTSLLGLVVYPYEKGFAELVQKLSLAELEAQGWPHWDISLGAEHCQTLGQLGNRLRNAIAHRRVTFSTDSPAIEEVELEFEDQRPGAVAPHWRAAISAIGMLEFCTLFTQLIENVVG